MAKRPHVVLLLHGIRTQGEWAQRAAAVIERDPSIRVRSLRYEFFDVVRFLIPISAVRDAPVQRFLTAFRDESDCKPERISVVAHSFGTYIVAKVLRDEAAIRFHRLLFCGSIVRDAFEWHKVGDLLDADQNGEWHAVNDCGMEDVWPVLAKTITWGYGSSGRFGFGNIRVKDRFFPLGHSGFFDEEFIERYWAPYLSHGVITEGSLERPTTPWILSLLTVVHLKYLLLLALLAAAFTVFAPTSTASLLGRLGRASESARDAAPLEPERRGQQVSGPLSQQAARGASPPAGIDRPLAPPPAQRACTPALLSRGANVTASHNPSAAHLITDGEMQGNWNSGVPHTDGVSVEIALASTSSVSRVEFNPEQRDPHPMTNEVFGLDASRRWRHLGTYSGIAQTGSIHTLNMPTLVRGISKVRVRHLHWNGWVSWREIEVYGCPE